MNTRWRHGPSTFIIPPLDDFVGPTDGIFALPVIIDLEIGEEIVLYIRDQTPFMEELRLVKPFRLMLRPGVGRNQFGPVGFLVFWVPNPNAPDTAFAAFDVYLNPHNEQMLTFWRRLAAQSHWHVFLVDSGNEQREFFEFENTFNLSEGLDFMVKTCSPIQMLDFQQATRQFMQEHSIEDILKFPSIDVSYSPISPVQASASKPAAPSNPFSSPQYVSLFTESLRKHSSSPEITPEQHLEQLRSDLAQDLKDRKLIYLDTCHWVNVRHVMLQRPHFKAPYDRIVTLLELLRRKQIIICPVSCALFEELMKQTDPSSRAATANLMDYLSGGACIQVWIDMIRSERQQHIARVALGKTHAESEISVFTKAGFWAGEHLIDYLSLPNYESRACQKLYTDLRWAMSFQDYQLLPGWTKSPESFTTEFVKDGQKARAKQATDPRTFADLVLAARLSLFSSLKDDLISILMRLCLVGSQEKADSNIQAVLPSLIEHPTPWAMPSLQVLAAINASVTHSGRKTIPTDMYDFLHAGQAIP